MEKERLVILFKNSLETISDLVGDDDAFDFINNNIGISLEEYQEIINS